MARRRPPRMRTCVRDVTAAQTACPAAEPDGPPAGAEQHGRDPILQAPRASAFHLYSAGKLGQRWRCKRCVGEAVTRRHQKIKRILVAEAGGSCAVCSYERCVVNLCFHHVDPSMKSFGVTVARGKSLDAYRAEAQKCVLVCANCHGEIEAGLIPSPPPQARYESA
jgi:hypothetical protein